MSVPRYGAAAGMETKMDILSYTAVELGRAIKEGKTTDIEATEAVLAQIEKTGRN